jgi:hypothetical protein
MELNGPPTAGSQTGYVTSIMTPHRAGRSGCGGQVAAYSLPAACSSKKRMSSALASGPRGSV